MYAKSLKEKKRIKNPERVFLFQGLPYTPLGDRGV